MQFSTFRIALLLLLPLVAGGCMTSRTTTTDRTSVETALLSQAAEDSLARLDLSSLKGRSYYLTPVGGSSDSIKPFDARYLMDLIHRRLLLAGALRAPSEGDAEIILHPAVATFGIDDSSSQIGVPELPISLPGVGGFALPEVSLFKFTTQKARHRMFLYAYDRESGQLVFLTPTVTSQRYYNRFTLLFIINFRLTNLEKPY